MLTMRVNPRFPFPMRAGRLRGAVLALAAPIALAASCPAGRLADDLGKPVPGADLFIAGQPAGRSAADGAMKPACPGAGTLLSIEAEGFEPLSVAWQGGEVRLKPDHALRGRVVADGAGLAGAAVSLFAAESIEDVEDAGTLPPPLARSTTGVSGRFRFPGQPGGRYHLLLDASGRQEWLTAAVEYLPTRWSGRDFPLDAAVSLGGRVMAGGKPLAGAKIRLALSTEGVMTLMKNPQAGQPGLYLHPLIAESDAAGKFMLPGLAPGRNYAVLITAAGYAPAWRDGLTPGQMPDVSLGTGTVITGHVRARDGKPLSAPRLAASMAADPLRWMLPGDPPAEVMASFSAPDGDGTPYRIEGVSERVMTLSVSAAGCAPQTATGRDAPERAEATRDFVLERGFTLRGTVVDAKGKPVKRGLLMPLKPGGRTFEFAGERGEVRDGEFQLAGLTEATVDLLVVAPGHAILKAAGLDASSSGVPLRLALSAPALLTGEVVDESGRPLNEFTVSVEGDVFTPAKRFTREDGKFTFKSLHGVTTAVSVTVEGRPPVSVDGLALKSGERRDLGRLVVAAGGGRLSGIVVDEQGGAIADAGVTIRGRADRRNAGETKSDAAGRFEYAGLTAGRYQVSVVHPDYQPGEADLELSGGAAEPVRIVLKRGARLTVELTDERGQPARGEIIMAPGSPQPLSEEAPGRYVAAGLSGDSLSLLFLTPPQFSRRVKLSEVQGVLRIRRGRGSLGGLVTQGTAPAAAQTVKLKLGLSFGSLEDMDIDLPGITPPAATTDAAGRYQFAEVAAGDYLLVIGATKRRVSVTDGAKAVENVALSGTRLRGCVKNRATGAPLTGAAVTYRGEDFMREQEQATGADGCFRFENADPGSGHLAVSVHSVRVTRMVELEAGDNETPPFDVEIGSGVINGALIDPAGKRIMNYCRVEHSPVGSDDENSERAERGGYALSGLPAGKHLLKTSCAGYAAAHATVELSDPERMTVQQDFHLVPESRIRVKLTSAEGAPVKDFFAVANASGECPVNVEMGFAHGDAGEAVIDELAACQYTVTAKKSGSVTDPVVVTLGEGEVKELQLKLRPGSK